ncbi:Mce-associated membrane protein [Herbihabitans rhizosphaerae]|uniref:Mce-associated membrane protein n=1 Tax=Herbihabitans rhizosphaerae TaxID=1872711 RepID=A0A4Q7KMP6_9PSEU|nr:hypothetical protein [Herbihabitans rhizosphaerae]RZS37200.1 Mce-associated membrane protein [Herbihabitans rhizosphaerae]
MASTTTETGPATGDPKPRRAHPFLLVAIALAVVAAVAAVWFGVAWMNASGDDKREYSSMRDEVSRTGQGAIVTLLSLDHRKADEGFDRWLSVSTGPYHEEIVKNRANNKKVLEQVKTVSDAFMLRAAVTKIEEHKGEAILIAAVRLMVSEAEKPPEPKYMRMQATMTRTDDGWKLSGLGQVPFTQAG